MIARILLYIVILSIALAAVFVPRPQEIGLPEPTGDAPPLVTEEHPAILPVPTSEPPPRVVSPPPRTATLQDLAEKLRAAKEQLELIRLPTRPENRTRISQTELYTFAEERVVNFFCDVGNREVAVATGVIIDARGYILTNAHVIEAPGRPRCLIRHGSPALDFAYAERVFSAPGFDPADSRPENLSRDVAIWRIMQLVEDTPIHLPFPAISVNPTYTVHPGDKLSTFSYPAELLGYQVALSELHLIFSETEVRGSDTWFIESTQGLGSQKGSSGGVLIDPYTKEFAGLIFAINDSKTEAISARTLFSLTPFAVNKTVRTATGLGLEQFFATNP